MSPALIIAAGRGSRLASRTDLKPLLPLGGKPLLEHVMARARHAGIEEFFIMTGYRGEQMAAAAAAIGRRLAVAVTCLTNDEWERANGVSVLHAQGALTGRFALLMADHIFAPELLAGLLREPQADDEVILAVDHKIDNHPDVDLDDVTRVMLEAGRITAIGKNLPAYNAFDTGLFSCSPALFAALATSIAAGDESLSGGIMALARQGKARGYDIGDAFWIDVDNTAMASRAEEYLATSKSKT